MPGSGLLSVVVPTYNRADVLADALESVDAQRWPNLEIVVVDDGSTDETGPLLEQYSRSTASQLSVIQENRGGPSKARNAGMTAASGDFVAFLDSDDVWVPGKLKAQMREFADPSVDLVFSAYIMDNRLVELPASGTVPDLLDRLLEGCCIGLSTVIARRHTILSLGGFDTALLCAEDHDLWLRMAVNGASMRYVARPLVRYRTSSDSLSRDHVRVARSTETVFERLFREGALPGRIQAKKRFYLARTSLNTACAYAEEHNGRSACRALARAGRLRPASIRIGWLKMAVVASLSARTRRPRAVAGTNSGAVSAPGSPR